MINALFFVKNCKKNNCKYIIGFKISGHAFFDNWGKDIVCAAVSSCVFMTANCVTEILKIPAKIKLVENNDFFLEIPKKFIKNSQFIMKALELHLINLELQYKSFLTVKYSEV